MPFGGRRIPFFQQMHKNQRLKKISPPLDWQNPKQFHGSASYIDTRFLNADDQVDGSQTVSSIDDSDNRLFHTICVGNMKRKEYQNLCDGSKNPYWVQLEESIIGLFKNDGQLKENELKRSLDNITKLLNANFTFILEKIERHVLPKAIQLLKSRLSYDGDKFLESLIKLWNIFYHHILSTLECMLFSIKPYNQTSIRRLTLIIYRNEILLDKSNNLFESKLKEIVDSGRKIDDQIVQMILILQSIPGQHENRIRMEKLAALAISPYVGHYGLYANHSQIPVIRFREPQLNHKQEKNGSLLNIKQFSCATIAEQQQSEQQQILDNVSKRYANNQQILPYQLKQGWILKFQHQNNG